MLAVNGVDDGVVFTGVTAAEIWPAIFSYGVCGACGRGGCMAILTVVACTGAGAEASIVAIEHGATAATRAADGLARFLDDLRSGDDVAKQRACAMLQQLAAANAAQRLSIGGAQGCITTLVSMIRSVDVVSQTKALSLLRALAMEAKNREAILKEDYVNPIVGHLRPRAGADCHAVQADAADTLGWLASTSAPARASFGEAGAIPLLLALAGTGVPVTTQTPAVEALKLLCSDSKNKGILLDNGGVVVLNALLRAPAAAAVTGHAVGALLKLVVNNAAKAAVLPAAADLVSLLSSDTVTTQRGAAAILLELGNSAAARATIAGAGFPAAAVNVLTLSGDEAAAVSAANLLNNLAADNAESRLAVAAGGCITPLISCLGSTNAALQQHAAETLGHLASNAASKKTVVAEGGIAPLAALLLSKTEAVAVAACNALAALVLSVPEHKLAVKDCAGALTAITALLNDGVSVRVATAAAAVVKALSVNCEPTRTEFVKLGALPLVVKLLQSADEPLRVQAAAAVGRLASDRPVREALVGSAAVGSLLAMLDASASADAHCESANALGWLALVAAHADAIVAGGAVPRLVALLQASVPQSTVQQAAEALKVLAANRPHHQATIAGAGAIAPLIAQLRGAGTNDKVKEFCAEALARLAGSAAIAVDMCKQGVLACLVDVLRSPTADVKKKAANALSTVASHAEVKSFVDAAGGLAGLNAKIVAAGGTAAAVTAAALVAVAAVCVQFVRGASLTCFHVPFV